jgi:hypothetical protein
VSATSIAQKVSGEHLARTAYLYVRQSTLRQVQTNTESGERQYALRQRAVQLGWPVEQIVVIDTDQDQSGASSTDREGFQPLVADVGLGKAGIVLGLEVSRLARNKVGNGATPGQRGPPSPDQLDRSLSLSLRARSNSHESQRTHDRGS